MSIRHDEQRAHPRTCSTASIHIYSARRAAGTSPYLLNTSIHPFLLGMMSSECVHAPTQHSINSGARRGSDGSTLKDWQNSDPCVKSSCCGSERTTLTEPCSICIYSTPLPRGDHDEQRVYYPYPFGTMSTQSSCTLVAAAMVRHSRSGRTATLREK